MTGAAGFIGSHLAERSSPTVTRSSASTRSTTTTTRPASGRTPSGSTCSRRISSTSTSTDCSTGVDGVYHLAGQPGVRASFGPDFVALRDAQRPGERPALRGRCAARRSASSTPRRPRSTATRRATRRARTRTPRPISPYGVSKLCVEHLAYAHARTAGLDGGRCPLLHRLRPAAAARHGVHAAARGARRGECVPPLRRRLGLAELHVRRRRGQRDDRRDGARPARASSTTSAAARRRR